MTTSYAPSPRHRIATHGHTWVIVHPPRNHRPTSHRRSRTRLMQLSVADLTTSHAPAPGPSRWKRLARFLFEWLVRVVDALWPIPA